MSNPTELSPQPQLLLCNQCGHKTNHHLVNKSSRRRYFEDRGYSITVGTIWELYQCCGCEEVTMTRMDWCSEDDPFENPPRPLYYPPRLARNKPDWTKRLRIPHEYRELLEEIYIALHADAKRLAVMGTRALIDCYIEMTIGAQPNFKTGLKRLFTEQLISQTEKEIIEAAIEAGHASAHRGHCPDADQIHLVIDIVENIIHKELLKSPASTLKNSVPKRDKSGKTKEPQDG